MTQTDETGDQKPNSPKHVSRLSRRLRSFAKYLHLPLFAVLPLLTFFLANAGEVDLTDPEIPIFILFNFAVALLIFVSCLVVLRNVARAAILSSLFIIFFFLYGHLEDALKNIAVTSLKLGTTKLILLGFVVTTAIAVVFLWRAGRKRIVGVNKALTIAAAFLFISTLAQIIPKELNQGNGEAQGQQPTDETTQFAATGGGKQPDVYYIVPDSYPRHDTLSKVFNFDNTEFLKGLEQRGFYVADKSHSNYAFTSFSVPSTLNMTYHNFPNPMTDESTLYLKQTKVASIMKTLGYKYIHVGTGWRASKNLQEGTDITLSGAGDDKSIDVLGLDIQLSEFMMVYTRTTALRQLLDKKIKVGLSNTVLDAMDAVRKIPELTEPTFTFVHLMVPHPPFIFDEHGPIDSQQLELIGDVFKDQEHFLAQLKFTNKLLLETIDTVLAKSGQKPIIVLASDHGSATILGHPANWPAPSTAIADGVRERMATLNTYYFPDGNYAKLYPEITPINTFPIIFNQYFGGSYETFPDKSFFSNYTKKNVLYDVTDLVK